MNTAPAAFGLLFHVFSRVSRVFRLRLRRRPADVVDSHKHPRDRTAPADLGGTNQNGDDRERRRPEERDDFHLRVALLRVLLESRVRARATGGRVLRLAEVLHVVGASRAHGHDHRRFGYDFRLSDRNGRRRHRYATTLLPRYIYICLYGVDNVHCLMSFAMTDANDETCLHRACVCFRSNNNRGAGHVAAGHFGRVHGHPGGNPRGRSVDTHRGLNSGQSVDGSRTAVVRCRRVPLLECKCFFLSFIKVCSRTRAARNKVRSPRCV